MTTQQEIQQEILHYLQIGGHKHLATSLDMVPTANQEAIYNMICDLQFNRTHKSVISLQVSEDVAAILEGKPENARFSNAYLTQ